MKKITFILTVILIFSTAVFINSAISQELDTDAIDKYIQNEMRISNIPGLALAVAKDGEIVYMKGYGSSGGNQPVTARTPFIIGSLSKSLTAVAAMQLVEEGDLELDQPVQNYLPWFTMGGDYNPADITIRHLLEQTSGIPNAAGNTTMAEGSDTTIEQEIRAMSEIHLENPPGETFIYSNANYIILGLVIETVADQSYSEYIRANLFEPLRMNDSYLSKEEGEAAGMSAGHIKWFGFPVAVDVQYLNNSLSAGFIISSAEDMGRYLMMHLAEGSFEGSTVLSTPGTAELHRPGVMIDENNHYAMGLIVRAENEAPVIMHDGATQGFNAGMAFSPEEQWGVVILSNMTSLIEMPTMNITLGVTEILSGSVPEASSRLPSIAYLVGLAVIIGLLVLTIRSIFIFPQRLPERIKESRTQGFLRRFSRIFFISLLELSVSVFVFIIIPAGAGFPVWQLLALFHPDLVYGLLILSILLLIKALWRIYLTVRLTR